MTAIPPGPLPAMRVLLVGMMGAGKSTVGRELSRLTRWPYFDNDELVERTAGKSARELLETEGVHALRRAESAALAEGLRERPPVIVGVAGGVVEERADRDRIRSGGLVVWIRASIDVLIARVGKSSDRPWLRGNPEAAMRRLYPGRVALYAGVASLVVDVDDRTPSETAGLIVDRLAGRSDQDRSS